MQDLYLTCSARADLEQSTAVRCIEEARVPSVRGVASWQPVLSETAHKRPRMLVPWRHSKLVPALREVPQAACQPAVQKKLRELFRLAAEHFLDFEALGLSPVDWQDEQSIEAAEKFIMSSAFRCSKGHLSQVTSCLRRWIKISKEMKFSLSNPSPAQLTSLLQKISFGGPTAASGVFSSLAWCNKHLGATCRTSVQAPELQPWEVLNLLAVTSELTGAARVVGAFILASAVSCIRFRHFQRSIFVAKHEEPPLWLEFRCTIWGSPESRVLGRLMIGPFRRRPLWV